jgi:lipopolysaccharide export LptBFGC system permease protein LptF
LNSAVGSIAPLIKYNNFNNPLKKITIYVGKKNQINELEDIILFENNAEKSKTIIAKSGVILNENNKNLLVLLNGSVQEENNKKIAIIDFDKITLDLSQYSKRTVDYYKLPEISSIELFKRAKNKNDSQLPDIISELNNRIVIPLFIPALVILACFLMSINREFINKTIFKIIIFSLGILIVVIGEILLNLSSKKSIANILLYSAPFFFLITNWFILNYFTKHENSKA